MTTSTRENMMKSVRQYCHSHISPFCWRNILFFPLDSIHRLIIYCYGKLECIPVGCVPPAHWPHLVVSARGSACPEGGHARGVHAGGHVCWGMCVPGGMPGGAACPHMDIILDTRLWKHYLPATTVAGGNDYVHHFSNLICILTTPKVRLVHLTTGN